jgi:hypothetical protein
MTNFMGMQAPHLFATGGGDKFVRLYDRRMLMSRRNSSASGYVGQHIPYLALSIATACANLSLSIAPACAKPLIYTAFYLVVVCRPALPWYAAISYSIMMLSCPSISHGNGQELTRYVAKFYPEGCRSDHITGVLEGYKRTKLHVAACGRAGTPNGQRHAC